MLCIFRFFDKSHLKFADLQVIVVEIINKQDIVPLIKAAASAMDPRMIQHGARVAYFLYYLLKTEGGYSSRQTGEICMLGLLHDIGAYKTEDIDDLLVFENKNFWEHCLYGSAFLKTLSPLSAYAPVILYHHLDYLQLKDSRCPGEMQDIAEKLYIANQLDLYFLRRGTDAGRAWFDSYAESRFSPRNYRLMKEALAQYRLIENYRSESSAARIDEFIAEEYLSEHLAQQYLKMMIYFIDLRSRFTVNHSIACAAVSCTLGRFLNVSSAEMTCLYWGAYLHDIGKIAVPVSLIEKTGRLTPEEMEIVKLHVTYTEQILSPYVNPAVVKVAARHHEKLDGSGYPHGLFEKDLSLLERVVAVADIVSALTHERSYKRAFSEEETLSILKANADAGKISPLIVSIVNEHYHYVMNKARIWSEPVFKAYGRIVAEHERLKKAVAEEFPAGRLDQERLTGVK